MGLVLLGWRFALWLPLLQKVGLTPQLSIEWYIVFIVAVLLIMSSGYLFNAYHDISVDLLNRPGAVVVDRWISRKAILIGALTCAAVGSGLGLIVTIIGAGLLLTGLLFPLSAVLLWQYSTVYQRMALAGVLTLAFLGGLFVWLPFLLEANRYEELAYYYPVLAQPALEFTIFYSLSAFALNFLRALTADIVDMDGDWRMGARTFPIQHGIPATRRLLLISTLLYLGYVLYFAWRTGVRGFGFYSVSTGILVGVPLLVYLAGMTGWDDAPAFRRGLRLIQIAMIGCSLTYLPLYWSLTGHLPSWTLFSIIVVS